MNMFEVVLSTMESKLKRVENLDRAVEHLMRKMDTLESKIETKSDEISHKISSALDGRKPDLEAQPSNRQTKVYRGNKRKKKLMNEVRHLVNDIDRRLGFHINVVSENLGKMTNLVEEVHDVVMDQDLATSSSQWNPTVQIKSFIWVSRNVYVLVSKN